MKTECCGGAGACNSGRECPLRYHPETRRANRCSLSAIIGVVALGVIGLAMCGALSGCERAEVKVAESAGTVHKTVIYRDEETGREYVAAAVGGALTPRMGRDGKQICRDVK